MLLTRPRPHSGVARQHFIGQGITFRADNQRRDHLDTVGPFVPAVTKATLVSFGKGRIALKIGAGQIVKQHVELGAKLLLPPALQIFEQFLPMFEQSIQTAIQIVFGENSKIPKA